MGEFAYQRDIRIKVTELMLEEGWPHLLRVIPLSMCMQGDSSRVDSASASLYAAFSWCMVLCFLVGGTCLNV